MEYITVENFLIVALSEFGIIVTLGIMMFNITGKQGNRINNVETDLQGKKEDLGRVWTEISELRRVMEAQTLARNNDNMVFAETLGKFNQTIGKFDSTLKSFQDHLELMRKDFKDHVNDRVSDLKERLDREDRIRNGK